MSESKSSKRYGRIIPGLVVGNLTILETFKDVNGQYKVVCRCHVCGGKCTFFTTSLYRGKNLGCEKCRYGVNTDGDGPRRGNRNLYKFWQGNKYKFCSEWRESYTKFKYECGIAKQPKCKLVPLNRGKLIGPGNFKWVKPGESRSEIINELVLYLGESERKRLEGVSRQRLYQLKSRYVPVVKDEPS